MIQNLSQKPVELSVTGFKLIKVKMKAQKRQAQDKTK